MATVYYNIASQASNFLFGDMLSAAHILPNNSSYRRASPYAAGEYAKIIPEYVISFPNAASVALEGKGVISLCGWAYPTSLSGTQHIIKTGYSGGATSALRIIFNGSALEIGGRSQSTDSFQNIVAATGLSVNTWVFFAAVYKYSTSQLLTKVDSAALATNAVTFGAPTLASGLSAIAVGSQPDSSSAKLSGYEFGLMFWSDEKNNAFFESLRTAQLGLPTTTVGANTASFTIDLKKFDETAAASETDIDVVVLDAATGAAVTRVLHVVPAETADGAGQLVVSLPNSLLNNGDKVLVGLTNTNGVPGTMSKQHFYPVQVTV